MQTSDVNNNKDGRMDQIDLNATTPKPDKVKPKLPQNKRFGTNSDGYSILPDEGK